MKIVADANIPSVEACCSSVGEVLLLPQDEITKDAVRDADALLVRSYTKVNADLLEGSRVQFVATSTIGVDHIDLPYLKERDLGFSSAPGANSNSVAEYLVAALLRTALKHGFSLEGKSLGIVGVGNIGSKVELKAKALGLQVVLNDPPLKQQTGLEKYRPLEDLYGCDFITCHTPLEKEGDAPTYHLANAEFFRRLKSDAIFINTSRGGVAQTAAVRDALSSGHLKAALLDVWEGEPGIDEDLLRMAELSTAHIAGYSYDGKVAGMIMIYEALCAHFKIAPHQTIDAFLPEPQIAELKLNAAGNSDEALLWEAVSRIYDIERDHGDVKGLLELPAVERGAKFKLLRKQYPQRREFQNTKVVLENGSDGLRAKLSGIGFMVQG